MSKYLLICAALLLAMVAVSIPIKRGWDEMKYAQAYCKEHNMKVYASYYCGTEDHFIVVRDKDGLPIALR